MRKRPWGPERRLSDRPKRRVNWRWLLLLIPLHLWAGFLGERKVRDYAQWLLGPQEAMQSVEVETGGQGYLLWWRGEWRGVRARAQDIVLPNGLQIARLTLEVPRLRAWPWSRMPRLAEDIHLTADFREAGIQAFLQEKTRALKPLQLVFTLAPRSARLSAKLRLMGKEYGLNLTGQLGLGGRAQVVFMPSAADVQSVRLPAQVVETISEAFNPVIDLEVYPLEIRLENYQVEQGSLRVTGRARMKEAR